MTRHQLTTITRVMGWRVGPSRFLRDSRSWLSHCRFQQIADASLLLEKVDPEEYVMNAAESGGFRVWVRIAAVTGAAEGFCQLSAQFDLAGLGGWND